MNYQINSPSVPGMPDALTRAAFNQQMAQAHAAADSRYNMKPLDRSGFSRGAGQAAMAGIGSAQNLAQGVARAYAGNLQDAQTNAATQLGNQAAAEQLGLGVSGIGLQQSYANALAALQRQQQQRGVLSNLLGGNVDSFLGF